MLVLFWPPAPGCPPVSAPLLSPTAHLTADWWLPWPWTSSTPWAPGRKMCREPCLHTPTTPNKVRTWRQWCHSLSQPVEPSTQAAQSLGVPSRIASLWPGGTDGVTYSDLCLPMWPRELSFLGACLPYPQWAPVRRFRAPPGNLCPACWVAQAPLSAQHRCAVS